MGPGVRRDDVERDLPSLVLPLVPPRKIIRHVARHFVLEHRRALFQERHHAFLDVVRATARALAREIAAKTAPVSVALIRQMMWRMLGADDPMEAHKVDSRGIYARGRSADVKEGVMSFLEKRPAVFTDKVSSDMPDYFPWWDEREYE